MAQSRSAPWFPFIGNHRCVDFVNTEVNVKGQRRDLLTDFGAWLAWLVQARVIDDATARTLGDRWAGKPAAERALDEVWDFRRILRETLERITQGKSIPREVVEAVNRLLRARTGYVEVTKVRGGFAKRVHAEFAAPGDLLFTMAEAAGDLLCDADFSLIRRCENHRCILFFYDQTKNHSRRWCSMQWCGNRMKVAAFYQRRREQDAKAKSPRRSS
jgi:predicted RNA-binding Zn ribbon-like protein